VSTTITITVVCSTAAEARQALTALAAPAPAEVPAAATDGAAEPAPAPAAEPAPAPAAEPAAPPTLDEAIEALKTFGRANGAVALKGVLDQLGVRRATEIQPEQVGALIAAMDGAAG
jgi:hypothetical protein